MAAHAMIKELQLAARSSGAHALRTQALWSDESIMHFLARAGFRLRISRIVLDRPCTRRPERCRRATPRPM